MKSHFLRAVPKGSIGVDLTYHTGTSATTGSSPLTFSSVSIGNANANRTVFVSVVHRGSTNPLDISAVTIGGVSATKLVEAPQAVRTVAEIWAANVSSGTTADIVFTYTGGSLIYFGIATYSALNVSLTAFDTKTLSSSNATNTVNINVIQNGAIIAALASGQDMTATTWTGVIRDIGVAVAGDGWASASQDLLSAETGRTVNVQTNTGANNSLAVVSIQPV